MIAELIFLIQKEDSPFKSELSILLQTRPQATVTWPSAKDIPSEILASGPLIIWDVSGFSVEQRIRTANLFSKQKTSVFLICPALDESISHLLKSSKAIGFFPFTQKSRMLDSYLEIALATHRRLWALEGQLLESIQELEERRLIEKAKWLIMRRLSYSEKEAIDWLREQSRNSNKKMAQVAQIILTTDYLGNQTTH